MHTHPYAPFLFQEATKLIIGTLPPPRFTQSLLKPGDVNFCYGSRDGQLWPILDQIFDLHLDYENTSTAIKMRKSFLRKRKIGICDIVESAEREKIDASDLGMQKVILRDITRYLKDFPNIKTILFTGGNSKNGPEYFFRKHLKEKKMALTLVNNEVPRIHEFSLCDAGEKRAIRTVSLTAPSGAANRAVGSMAAYKEMKKMNPSFNTLDFRVLQYKAHF